MCGNIYEEKKYYKRKVKSKTVLAWSSAAKEQLPHHKQQTPM
jgi:hypothetical protein